MDSPNPVQKSGFLNIKVPIKTHGIRIKAWKRKWIILHQMSDLSAGKSVAKLDIYNEKDAGRKHSILFENVTLIKRSSSKTMAHAFVLIDDGFPIRFSGESETESQEWIDALRDIFWPIKETSFMTKADNFIVSVKDNPNSDINGRYFATVSPSHLQLLSTQDGATVRSWKITQLKRFFISPPTNKQCDNNSSISFVATTPTQRDETYTFFCQNATKLMTNIKNNVDIAFNSSQLATHNSDTVKPQFGHQGTTVPGLSSHDKSFEQEIANRRRTVSMVITSSDEDGSSEEYSQLDFHKPPPVQGRRSSTFSGRDEFNKTTQLHHSHSASQLTVRFKCPDEYFVDDSGYSHLPIKSEFSSQNSIKMRSFSNSSSVSQKSSSSHQSRDSGIAILKYTAEEPDMKYYRHDSIDSACEDKVSADDIYQCMDTVDESIQTEEPNPLSNRPNPGYENIENLRLESGRVKDDEQNLDEVYEELGAMHKHKNLNTLFGVDKSLNLLGGRKKNLEKLLGYDEKEKEKPPSLPERPVSAKLKRRKTDRLSKTKAKWNSFTFASIKSPDMYRGRSFSTSSSGSEDEINALIQKIGGWNDPPDSLTGVPVSAGPAPLVQQTAFKMAGNSVVRNSLYSDIKPIPKTTSPIKVLNPTFKTSSSEDIVVNTKVGIPQQRKVSPTPTENPQVADLLTFDTPPQYQNVFPRPIPTPRKTENTNWAVFPTLGSPQKDDPFDAMRPIVNSTPKKTIDWSSSFTFSPIGSPKNDDPFDASWAQAILSPSKLDEQLSKPAQTTPNKGLHVLQKDKSFDVETLFSFEDFFKKTTPFDSNFSNSKPHNNLFADSKSSEENMYMDMTQSPKTLRHMNKQTDDVYVSMSPK